MDISEIKVDSKALWTDRIEWCEGRQCMGTVTSVTEAPNTRMIKTNNWIRVRWDELCALHEQIDPLGTGPYNPDSLTIAGRIIQS